jgi:hypothetical protein
MIFYSAIKYRANHKIGRGCPQLYKEAILFSKRLVSFLFKNIYTKDILTLVDNLIKLFLLDGAPSFKLFNYLLNTDFF